MTQLERIEAQTRFMAEVERRFKARDRLPDGIKPGEDAPVRYLGLSSYQVARLIADEVRRDWGLE